MIKNCCVCGKELGLLAGTKLVDGHICRACLTKSGIPMDTLSECAQVTEKTCTEMKMMVEEKEMTKRLLKDFTFTKKISNSLAFDDNNKLFLVNSGTFFAMKSDIFRYEQIAGFELLEDGETIVSGGLGRAAIGAVTFGAVGAIVGGITGKKTTKGVCTSLQVKIILRDCSQQTIYITFLDAKTKKNSILYKQAITAAQEALSSLQLAMEKSKEIKVEKTEHARPAEAVVDQILKYKTLLDEDIITKEEFEAVKKKLLGI